MYIHRSGRTARATAEGLSVVLVGPDDVGNYRNIMKQLNKGRLDFSYARKITLCKTVFAIVALTHLCHLEEMIADFSE